MRAIDADALKAEAKDQLVAYFLVIKSWVPTYGETTIMDIIDRQPTIETVPIEDYRSMEQTVYKLTQALAEAEPIKHGRWEVVYYDNIPTLAYCNRCDQVLQLTRETEKLPNYCPNCGAKMDEPAPEAAEIINDGTYSAGNLYECDPEKNTECRKTGCYINGGECRHTTHAEYAREEQE